MHRVGRKIDGEKSRSQRLYDVGPPVLLLFLTIIFFWRQLILGESLYWGDIGLYFQPMQHFLHDQLTRGRLPLWNPYILCGAPYVGNPQTWPLYPSSLLLFAMPAERAIGVMIAIHVWLAGWGMYRFLRSTAGLRISACLLTAVVFMFGGQLVSKEQFPNMVQAAAYLPWMLLAVDRLARRRDFLSATILGAALGLQLLAAHAQITLLTLYLCAAYGVMRVARIAVAYWSTADVSRVDARRKMLRESGKLSLAVAGSTVLAAGLSAGQVLPIVELIAHAWRQKLTFKIVNRFYLPPNQLLNFTLPRLHGHPYFGDFTARGNFWETCCYVGWLPVIAACVAVWLSVFRSRRRRPVDDTAKSHDAVVKVRFWAIAFVIGTWMATGKWGHLYRGAYNIAPGFRSFHDPSRCLLWSSASLAILAGYGLHALARRLDRSRPTAGRWTAAAVVAVAFVDLAHFGWTLYPLATPSQMAATVPGGVIDWVKADHGIRIDQARVLGPDSARSWERFTTHKSYRQAAPRYHELWRDTLTPNLSMDAGIPDAYGYEPETRFDAQRVLGMIDSGYDIKATPHQRAIAAALSGIYGVRYVVTQRVEPPEASGLDLSTIYSEPTLPLLGKHHAAGHIYLSRDLAWQPRARLTTAVVDVADRWQAIRDYEAYFYASDSAVSKTLPPPVSGGVPRYEAGWVPHVTLAAGDTRGIPNDQAPVKGSVDVADPSPDEVDVTAVGDRPSLLVLADTLHPGWSATVDGHREPILSVDGFIRGVTLPDPGRHMVRFTYRPSTFFIGLYFTLLTTGAILGILVRYALPRRGGRKKPRLRLSETKVEVV